MSFIGGAGWSSPPPVRERETGNKTLRATAMSFIGGAGWSSPVARQAHNLKVVGSNPTPATNNSFLLIIYPLATAGFFVPRALTSNCTVIASAAKQSRAALSQLWIG
jgi:glucose uptake protein GlcU